MTVSAIKTLSTQDHWPSCFGTDKGLCSQVDWSQIAFGDNGLVRLDLTALNEYPYTGQEIIKKSGLTPEELESVSCNDLIKIIVNQHYIQIKDRCIETNVVHAAYSLWKNLDANKQEAVRLVLIFKYPCTLYFLEWASVVAQADKIHYIPYSTFSLDLV